MTTLENLLSFESTLMDWMLAIQPKVLAASAEGRELLKERQRVYDTLNELVSNHENLTRLETNGGQKLAALQQSLIAMPTEPEATERVLKLVRSFLATIASAASVSGEHVIGRRTSAA